MAVPFTVDPNWEDDFGPFVEAAWTAKTINPPMLTLNDVENLTPAVCEGDHETGQLGELKISIKITYNGNHYHYPAGALVKFSASGRELKVIPILQLTAGSPINRRIDGGRRTNRKKGRKSRSRK
jgi:hypothetical protein